MSILSKKIIDPKYPVKNDILYPFTVYPMRSFLIVLVGSVLFLSGCADRPELSPSAYGTILDALPEAEEPFIFPVEGENHLNCDFSDDLDFM